VEDGVQQKAWLCGSPEYFIETLKEMEEKYPGLEDVFLQWPEGMPWSEMSDQLEIFSKEVIPAFNGRG
jgi:hypothetical protein